MALPGGYHAFTNNIEAFKGAVRVFVAQCHEHGGANANGAAAVRRSQIGRGFSKRVFDDHQQPKPDNGIPEPKHRPWQAHQKAAEHNAIDHRPTTVAQNVGHPVRHPEVGDQIEHGHKNPPPHQFC